MTEATPETQLELQRGLVAGLLGMGAVDHFFVVGVNRDGDLRSLNQGNLCTLIGAVEVAAMQMKQALLSKPPAPVKKRKK